MFVNINKYLDGSHSHNPEIIGKQVVLYPENQLPDLVVDSDFGVNIVFCFKLAFDIYRNIIDIA